MANTIISIHSLVKRETRYQIEMRLTYLISIHSLVKRETHDKMHVVNFSRHFNPLPRKEGDRFFFRAAVVAAQISIHSLVKRETCCICLAQQDDGISIHSLVKRETSSPADNGGNTTKFQSTPS